MNSYNQLLLIFFSLGVTIWLFFGGLSLLADGGLNFGNLPGATVGCSADTEPTIEIVDVRESEDEIVITVRSSSECEIATISVEEIVSTSPTNPPIFTYERHDAINQYEGTSVFSFRRSNYNQPGGYIRYTFTATTTEGQSSTITAEGFRL